MNEDKPTKLEIAIIITILSIAWTFIAGMASTIYLENKRETIRKETVIKLLNLVEENELWEKP